MAVLSAEFGPGKRIPNDHMVAKRLANAVAEFVTRLERESLSGEVAEQLSKLLRAEQHLLACADQSLEIARAQRDLRAVNDEQLQAKLSQYRLEVVHLMELSNIDIEVFTIAECQLQLGRMQVAYDEVKAELLQAGAQLRIDIPLMILILEQNSRIRRMARQMYKAIEFLGVLYITTEARMPKSDESDEIDEVSENTAEPAEAETVDAEQSDAKT